MPQDNGLLLLIGQRGQNLRVNFGKSIIGRSKDSQSFSSLQSVDQTQIADNRDQSFEGTSADGNIDNVSKRFFFFHFFGSGCSQNDAINDMDDSIAGHNIGSHNIRNTAIVVDLNATFFSFYEINGFASDGLHRASGNGSGRYFSGDNMSQDNFLLLLSGQ